MSRASSADLRRLVVDLAYPPGGRDHHLRDHTVINEPGGRGALALPDAIPGFRAAFFVFRVRD